MSYKTNFKALVTVNLVQYEKLSNLGNDMMNSTDLARLTRH